MVGDEVMFGKYILVERLIEKLAVMKKEDRLKIVKGGDRNSSWGYLFPIKEFDTKWRY